jgi:transaldolase
VTRAQELSIKIFADGADLEGMAELVKDPLIAGFTTNPTLMRQSGVADYAAFARRALDAVDGRPVSFEVISDDFDEMGRQARVIASWGDNVYVKIPVTNTRGQSSAELIRQLTGDGLRLNVTAILSLRQVEEVVAALAGGAPAVVSVFAGRIADTGRDPAPLMRASAEAIRAHASLELLWASPREVLNACTADEVGCHIITMTRDLLRKLANLGRDLEQVSLDTVRMFRDDALSAGYSL